MHPEGKSDRSEPVDYVLNCERPRSFLIASTHPAFVVGETKNVATENKPTSTAPEKPGRPEQDLLRQNGLRIHTGKESNFRLR